MITTLFLFLVQFSGCKKDSDGKKVPPGSIVDKDGNVYHTVAIGGQTWLLENLKTTHYNNNDPIIPGKMYKAGVNSDTADSYAGFFGFIGLGMWNSLWTSTSVKQWYADAWGLVYSNGKVDGAHLGDGSKSVFFSIRCVQDVNK
jgi:hypothetical protein